MPPSIQSPWGKWNGPGDQLSLLDHSADVAACAEALLRHTSLGRRLARLGGFDDAEALPPELVARLGYLAALHDLGKAGVRFQRKVLDGVQERAGHVKEALALLDRNQLHALGDRFHALIPSQLGEWGDEAAIMDLLTATFCHHGRPHNDRPEPSPLDWKPRHGLDPFATLAELIAAAQGWFPTALGNVDLPLPASPAFQHGWNGVLNLADWLGSNSAFFPFDGHLQAGLDRMDYARRRVRTILRDVGLDVTPARLSLGAAMPGFGAVSDKPSPRPAQEVMSRLPLHREGSLTVLEASTGAGKTEAALWHFARLFHAGLVDGMTFALPTRIAATQIEGRMQRAMQRCFPDPQRRPPVVLAVPGYLQVDGVRGYAASRFVVQWDDDRPAFSRRAWAGEHSKRYLAGGVVVGTVDQVLLSGLQVRHTHLRAACLLRHLLVVDEIHASDAYMTRTLQEVLEHQQAAGGHTLLMSATLGAGARTRLLTGSSRPPSLEEAIAKPYPLICHRPVGSKPRLHQVVEHAVPAAAGATEKTIDIELSPLMEQPEAIAARALDAAAKGARVLVVRNTVAGCRDVQRALLDVARADGQDHLLFAVTGDDGQPVPCPHHGRFAPSDRRLLDAAIEEAFEPSADRRGGRVAVATQTVEQSLDLDADLLITDLCPMDVLLQRIGRLHRHTTSRRPPGFETARCDVLVPAHRDLASQLRQRGTARGVHGLGGKVYPDLRIVHCTWAQLEAHPTLRLPSMNRELVERSTHPEALQAVDAPATAWKEHGVQNDGKQSADRGHAANSVMRWTRPFGKDTFHDDRQIATRLGDRDLVVALPEEPTGPFGKAVPTLHIPAWFFHENALEALAQEPVVESLQVSEDGGFEFVLGSQSFRYDALGLDLSS